MGVEHAAAAPTAHEVALRLHFGPQPARAVALAVIGKVFAHRHLPARLDCRLLPAALSGIIRGRHHP